MKNQKLLDNISGVINDIKSTDKIFSIANIKKLKGNPTAYSIRIGDFRLGFFYEDHSAILTRFLNRKDIYKFFP